MKYIGLITLIIMIGFCTLAITTRLDEQSFYLDHILLVLEEAQ